MLTHFGVWIALANRIIWEIQGFCAAVLTGVPHSALHHLAKVSETIHIGIVHRSVPQLKYFVLET